MGAVTREVHTREHQGRSARVVLAACAYDTTNVQLTEMSGGGTQLRLEHIAHVQDDFWNQYGPGAVGAGCTLLTSSEIRYAAGFWNPSPAASAAPAVSPA